MEALKISLDFLAGEELQGIQYFQYYKINFVKFEFYPYFNAFGESVNVAGGTVTSNPTAIRPTYTLFLSNTDDSIQQTRILNHPNARRHNSRSNWRRMTKVKTTAEVGVSGATDVDVKFPRRLMISTEDFPTFGNLFVTTGLSPSGTVTSVNPQYEVRSTFYVTMYNYSALPVSFT